MLSEEGYQLPFQAQETRLLTAMVISPDGFR